MDLRILTFLLLFISASAQYCGSKSKLKACTCKDKIGKIYSPVDTGYLSCEWPIRADKRNHVVLLESVFVNIDSSKNCSNDYLEVFDGPSVTSPSLGQWCTDGISVRSSGREMLVLYRTDGVTTGAPNRFKLTYKATAGESSNLGLILGLSIPFGLVGLMIIIFMFTACRCDSGKGTSTGGVRWSGGGYGGGGGGGGCGGGGGGCGGGGGGGGGC